MNSETLTKRPIPSEIKVSTMTATCIIYQEQIDLNSVFTNVKLDSVYLNGIKFLNDYKGRPDNPSKKKKKSDKSNPKTFCNQATIYISPDLNSTKIINVKLFKNGKLQMTGLRNFEEGKDTALKVIEILKNVKYDNGEVVLKNKFNLENYDIHMINSNFDMFPISKDMYRIKRQELFKLLKNPPYYLKVSYEPTIYPGVKVSFMWNKTKGNNQNGVCCCDDYCNGKSKEDNKCKKITIAIFQSGSIIITGAYRMEQIQDAYKFINDVFSKHYDNLVSTNNKIVYIKKSSIMKGPTPKLSISQ